MMLGFDYVIGSQLAALTQFQKFFGVQLSDGSYIVPAKYLSAWGSIGLGCDVIASWLAAPILEKYGRKPLILFAAGVSTVAIVLQQLATDWKVHLAGRAVNGSWFCMSLGSVMSKWLIRGLRYCYRHHVHHLTLVDW